MKHLTKITLSNIRRFAENVDLEIGEGATIFLAPNGTGKTAIFEAIEMALTGNVKHLMNPLDSMIRDACELSSVRLQFDQGELCEATLQRNSGIILSGAQDQIFNSLPVTDRPFLLQLTHFLNQRGEDWFVQDHGESAGSQLEHLAIGREASEAIKLIPSAKKAAGTKQTELQRQFDEAADRLKRWELLLQSRNQFNSAEATTNLPSKAQLLAELNTAGQHIRDLQELKEDQLLSMKVRNNEIRTLNEARLTVIERRLLAFELLRNLPEEYLQLEQSLAVVKLRVASLQETRNIDQKRLIDLQALLDSKLNTRQELSATLLSLRNEQAKLDQFNKITAEIQAAREQLPALEQITNEVSGELNTVTEQLNTQESLLAQYRQIDQVFEDLTKRQNTVDRLKQGLIHWQENQDQINVLNESVPTLLIHLSEASSELAELRSQRQKLERELKAAEASYAQLNAVNDHIQSAIGIIVSRYPKDEGDCPVCGAVYEPDELQSRMQAALEAFNPALSASANELKHLRTQFSRVNGFLVVEQQGIDEAEEALNSIASQISTLDLMTSQTLPQELLNLTLHECERLVASRQAEIDNERREASERQQKLSERPVQEAILALRQSRVDLNERFINLLASMQEFAQKVISLTETQQALSDTLRVDEELSGTRTRASELQIIIDELSNEIGVIRVQVEDQQRQLDQTSDGLIRTEINVSESSTRLSELQIRWSQGGLIGIPARQALEVAIANVIDSQRTLQVLNDSLTQIDANLAKWQVIEDSLNHEKNIQDFRGNKDESTFQSELLKEVERKRFELEHVTRSLKALSHFASNLEDELKTVHERIRAINPLWQRLLKRIVIDPRFAGTQLENYNKNRKQHANINVPLHNKEIFASEVASEAQITDLQLTFMLAMAQKHSWSPWQGLLLDDPTQHHDLVHASSVFDLLRDYIAEYGFQVVLATHDTSQAKFFMRKLQNDGIPSKLYNLYAADDGVRAKLLA